MVILVSVLLATMQSATPFPTPMLRRVKRERLDEDEPILISSRSPSPAPRSSKRSRDRLFAALENGDPLLRLPRTITTADDLDEVELKRCFEVLHACAVATDPTATLTSTHETMEGFLDAVFKDWTGNASDDPAKPALDFVLREYISVGNVCRELQQETSNARRLIVFLFPLEQPSCHRGKSCADAPACRVVVYVMATYRSRPAQLEIGYCFNEPSSDDSEFFCPIERDDIR
ncbi:hypothetical protein AK830_g9313 [Neonectria ditissima]|uniref:Uncharacterized protein n=1 Tax=Neonectria ditissima TaxID=78410 RepID=A0A0P7AS30_9HYPO|nr:hypothetical protein AK830_g9313 [Neonectria ditissima]